ncbi:uncharacterized protein LOC143918680 [Arctopsyche grandis]|uniref:uncharacterized protein LOC143918680 n=1 Tax=Arctopsyche grandis TaxID=121162 RepID=UPI00406D7B02
MNSSHFSFLAILITYYLSHEVLSKVIVKYCYNKHADEPVMKEKNIDASLKQTIILECRTCSEESNRMNKHWFKRTIGTNNTFSDEFIVSKNDSGNVYLDHMHRFVIRDITVDDIGLYYCKHLQDDHIKEGYIYFVDIVDTSTQENLVGNSSVWSDFYFKYIQPTNEKLEGLGSNLTVFLEWETWSPCSPYDSFHKRTQSRIGKCRIRSEGLNISVEIDKHRPNLTLSCRSQLLLRIRPDLKQNLSSIPHYKYVKQCINWFSFEDDPNFESEEREVTLFFGSDLITVCPHSNVYSNLTWFKDDRRVDVLNDVDDLHVFVDVFNILYLSQVGKKDSGLYSCTVDGKKSLNLTVVVVSKPKLVFGVFLRHSLYLFFIAYAFIPVYCFGLKFYLKRRVISRD